MYKFFWYMPENIFLKNYLWSFTNIWPLIYFKIFMKVIKYFKNYWNNSWMLIVPGIKIRTKVKIEDQKKKKDIL